MYMVWRCLIRTALALAVCVSPLSAQAQIANPRTAAQSIINSTIIPNGVGAISGGKMNTALNSLFPMFDALVTFGPTGTVALNPGIQFPPAAVRVVRGDGVTTAFAFSTPFAANLDLTKATVAINGIPQSPGSYTVTAIGITFNSGAPPSGTTVAISIGSIDANVPPISALAASGKLADATAAASPAWSSYSGPVAAAYPGINGLPLNTTLGQSAGRNFGVAYGALGSVDTPSTDTVWNGGVNIGLGGYARSASPTKGSVGVFGGGMQAANGTSQWGGNFICSNTTTIEPVFASNTGFPSFTCNGAEIDVYTIRSAGGATPTGTARGLVVTGQNEVVPTGGAYGITVNPFNTAATLGWVCAICITDGPNRQAIQVGAFGLGNGVSSQLINFKSRNGAGVEQYVGISIDPNGNLLLPGSTDGSTGAAGYIGEHIRQVITASAAKSVTSGVGANVALITLSAGDWVCSGNVVSNPAAGTTQSDFLGSISQTSASPAAPPVGYFRAPYAVAAGVSEEGSIAPFEVVTTAPTAEYLVGYSVFATSTNALYGSIDCMRTR